MQLENKKIKFISESFGVSEDLVKSILDSYMAMSLYNMNSYKVDDTIFGVMKINKEKKMLEIIDNTDYIDNIFTGKISFEIIKRYLMFSENKI